MGGMLIKNAYVLRFRSYTGNLQYTDWGIHLDANARFHAWSIVTVRPNSRDVMDEQLVASYFHSTPAAAADENTITVLEFRSIEENTPQNVARV